MLRNLLTLRHVSQRAISSSSRRPLLNKIPDKQKLFQEDNGIPVHLKGGVGDALFYRGTMVLTVLGTGYALYELFIAAMPKKQN
ncbi:cytochrome c oxidase subunit 7A2, mitochondrial [Pelobates cultripes]|nr:cytochrome c oxidase subunit 7A2, mitochondrial [Pelobates cultripes]